MSLRLACDFDGSLAVEPLAWRPGALEALIALKNAGYHLILHSCRCNPVDPAPVIEDEVERFYRLGETPQRVLDQWARFLEMRTFLMAAGAWRLFDEIWTAPGKPPVDLFIDDKMEPPNWRALVEELAAPPRVAVPA